MSLSKTRFTNLAVAAIVLATLAAGAVGFEVPAPAGPQDKEKPPRAKEQLEESPKKVKELHKQRIAACKDACDVASNLFKAGRVSQAEVYEARLMVLQAELDAAEKESDRRIFYKPIADLLMEYEGWAIAQEKEAGLGSSTTALKVKVRRLEAEIRLEQAKAKEAKDNK